MTGKHLHIVCLDVPYPVNHGGMFDLFYKLVALKKAGIRIHLHCFEYGKGEQPVLNEHCESVHYYPRRTGIRGLSRKLPYIVSSRDHPALAERLLLDDHPILLEGIHCTSILNDDRFNGRKIFVRLHNVEHEYYEQLARSERSPVKKIYYTHESRLLKKYESQIAGKAIFLTVSEKDADTYRNNFQARVKFLPVFLAWDSIEAKTGFGQFSLYHGNLSVAENAFAVNWLLKEVFSGLQSPFVIAGKDPSRKLQHLMHRWSHICFAANPANEEMDDLIKKAHINILPAFNNTGVKLKLLHALFQGRHCIVNRQTVEGSGLESCCHIADTASEMKAAIKTLIDQEFTEEMIRQRSDVLLKIYNNEENCRKLTGMIW
ncbi:MAG TPA: glycosyltransferase [Chitinophagaceae bacterium]